MNRYSRGHTDGSMRAGLGGAVLACALLHAVGARAQAPEPDRAMPPADPGGSPAAPPAGTPSSAGSLGAATSPEPAATAAPAMADPPAETPPEGKPSFTKTVGGHIGIATPLVTVASDTKTIGDQFTILNPIGIGFHVSDDWIVDFEMVVANPINPSGTTGLVVDPGIIHSFGRVAVGLRLAFQTNHDTNVGGIPLLNVGLVDLGGATWFVEAAFPTFYSDKKGEFNAVLHTGIGF